MNLKGARSVRLARAGEVRSSGRRRAVRSFTLIELMLVICILGILLATSLPRISGVHSQLQLREMAKTTCAELRFCQEYAVSEGVRVQLTYLPNLKCFRVEAATDVAGNQFRDLVTPWDGVLEVPPAVHVGSFQSLYPDGRKMTDQVVFDAYAPAPTVRFSLLSGQAQVSACYAGATRLAVIGE